VPQANKIEKYELQTRVLELSVGRNTRQVAAAITEELQAKGVSDSISQATVSRYLKEIREERAELTRTKVQEHIQEHVPADLNAIEEIEGWLLERFRGKVNLDDYINRLPGDRRQEPAPTEEDIQELAKEMAAIIDGDHKTRAEFGMKAARLIELKLKYAGILENPEAARGTGADPADLDEFRQDMEAERGQVHAH
jgi:uncharacterized protein (UPF0147 family)